MKRIAVLTSGGDAPGMNAAIRAVVEQGLHHGIEVVGIYNGYKGLVEGDMKVLTIQEVDRFLRLGGTFLYSVRYPEFEDIEIQKRAIEQLKKNDISGLIVIGGDGSLAGGLALTKHGFPVIGIPGTIDNDIAGTEYTIGFDTAVSVALDAIDKIADTASSHRRTFVIEVMGRHAGDIAIWAGVAAGADAIIIPEADYMIEDVVQRIKNGRKNGKDHSLVILAEGVTNAANFVDKLTKFEGIGSVRGVTLSHIQRGGVPTSRDRVFATLLGARAVDALIQGEKGIYLGIVDEQITSFDLELGLTEKANHIRKDLYQLNLQLTDI